MATDGRHFSLNLGPLSLAAGSRVALNLGVEWSSVDPPEQPAATLRRAAGLYWQPGICMGRVAAIAWSQAVSGRASASVRWRPQQPSAQSSVSLAWTFAPSSAGVTGLRWAGRIEQQRTAVSVPWQAMDRHQTAVGYAWRSSGRVRQAVSLPYRTLRATAQQLLMRWGSASITSRRSQLPWQVASRWESKRDLPWGSAKPLPWIVRPPVTPPEPEPEPPPYSTPGARVGLNLSCLPLRTRGLAALNLGVAACYVVRPHQRTYVVINTISVVRLPDRLPIEMAGVSINTSCDAWGSTFDFELADTEQLQLLKPSAAGPRQVEVTLNGYVWTALVESYSTRREWGGSGISLTGRSRTALLAAPYAPGRVKVTTEDRSVAQLVNEELADTGFTAFYDTVDWVVPAGAWFYDATTALDAISRLAEASGGVVQSDPAAQALQVRARYPDSPWHWKERTPDHVIYEDVVSNESLQMRSAPLYDAVVVTGELAGKGVTCKVRRSGEAGQLYAPQASSPLISTAAAGTERGRNILSDRGEQALVELVIPLFGGPLRPGEVGRVMPLDLVEVVGEEGTWHGLCIAARTEARTNDKAIVIEQTITLERHYTDAD